MCVLGPVVRFFDDDMFRIGKGGGKEEEGGEGMMEDGGLVIVGG